MGRAQVLVHILFKQCFLCGDENEEATATVAHYIHISLIHSKNTLKTKQIKRGSSSQL